MTLSDRIIAAGPDEAREVLPLLWESLGGDDHDGLYFFTMLNAHAHLSAAEMLVPEGWGYQIKRLPRRAYAVLWETPEIDGIYTDAPTAWQALAAAIAKTREAMMEYDA